MGKRTSVSGIDALGLLMTVKNIMRVIMEPCLEARERFSKMCGKRSMEDMTISGKDGMLILI